MSIRPLGTIVSYTTITVPPSGFEVHAPYTVAMVHLWDGGHLLGWLGKSFQQEPVHIGCPVEVFPGGEKTASPPVPFVLEKKTAVNRHGKELMRLIIISFDVNRIH